jgi:predicted Zn-dependent protease
VSAVALSVTQEAEDAESAFGRARALVREQPDAWLAWVSLGVAAARAGKFGELARDPASDPGSHAPLLAPNQPYAVFMKALSFAARGEREQAIEISDRALRMQPTNTSLLLARAELLAQLSACKPLHETVARIDQIAHHPERPRA